MRVQKYMWFIKYSKFIKAKKEIAIISRNDWQG